MKIQIFVFCWNDYFNQALEIEQSVKKFGEVIVINSNTEIKNFNWINLNDAYFAEQWNVLIQNIKDDTDFIWHIQSDCRIEDCDKLIENFNRATSKYDVGIYAPNIDYTWHRYDLIYLDKLDYNLYEVPNTDCTCWFINNKIIDKRPLYNLSTNYIGYGADWYYSVKSKLENKLVVRDYDITISHPESKGYDNVLANDLFNAWVGEQSNLIKTEILNLVNYAHSINLNCLN